MKLQPNGRGTGYGPGAPVAGAARGSPIDLIPIPDPERRAGDDVSILALAAARPDLYRVRAVWPPRPEEVPRPAALIAPVHGAAVGRVAASLLAKPEVRNWLSAGHPLILDDSGEVGIRNINGARLLRGAVRESGLVDPPLLLLMQNEEGAGHWARAGGPGDPTRRAVAIVFHFWLHSFVAGLRNVLPLAAVSGPDRPKRFICLNRKLRSHRAIVLGHLRREGLLEQGLISLVGLVPRKHRNAPETEAMLARSLREFPAHAADIEAARAVLEGGPLLARELRGAGPRNPLQREHEQASFSLVNETEMSDPQVRRYTEKVLKPLANGHPFLVFGNPGTLALLRDHGFRTFAPAIDESYDEEDDPQRRLALALAEARRVLRMDEAAFGGLIRELAPVLWHNARHIRAGMGPVLDAQHAAVCSALHDLVRGLVAAPAA